MDEAKKKKTAKANPAEALGKKTDSLEGGKKLSAKSAPKMGSVDALRVGHHKVEAEGSHGLDPFDNERNHDRVKKSAHAKNSEDGPKLKSSGLADDDGDGDSY